MGDPDLKQVRSGYARGQEAAGERGQARISAASRNNWDRSPLRLADRTPNELCCSSERALGKLIRFVACDAAVKALLVMFFFMVGQYPALLATITGSPVLVAYGLLISSKDKACLSVGMEAGSCAPCCRA
jgi:hypothetical protein